MFSSYHQFHIPVMGTGHSVDTPIRVAHLGIDSVISIVDDLLLERIRKYYAALYQLPFESIPRNAEDGRARRITAYLDLVQQIVSINFNELKQAAYHLNTEKDRYFSMLPTENPLRMAWESLSRLTNEKERELIESELDSALHPGSIDVNIMSKVDRLEQPGNGPPLSDEFSDACAALRGFAHSVVDSAVVLSAGFNPRLYNYLTQFPSFYRDITGNIRKKIILKVSDFRSAMIQGSYLAKKGLEVAEFRIESGLNCGGHAFYSDGKLLPVILDEFLEKKHQLVEQFRPLVTAFYQTMGWPYPDSAHSDEPKITVQGGIGTYGETRRLMSEYETDSTGWGSPFLLVPEATCVDNPTLNQLVNAGVEDLYLSRVSPLGVPFNNLRHSGSEQWTSARSESQKPGSPCPKGFLKTNTEFTDTPICTASTEYQLLKIAQISSSDMSDEEKKAQYESVMVKSCLCDHLGNGSLIALGIIKENQGPQAICPGPNIAWFNRPYSLKEMTDHIYGRGTSLVPEHRPHMFAKELEMNMDYFEAILHERDIKNPKAKKYVETVFRNLEEGIENCLQVSMKPAYPGENLTSLKETAEKELARLQKLQETYLETA